VQRAEAAASEALPSLDDMRARVAVLDRRKAVLSEELARLRHARELSVQQLASLTQHMTALKQATANLTASHTAQVPRVKCVDGPGRRGSLRAARREPRVRPRARLRAAAARRCCRNARSPSRRITEPAPPCAPRAHPRAGTR